MRIGVLGSGLIGGKLGTVFATAMTSCSAIRVAAGSSNSLSARPGPTRLQEHRPRRHMGPMQCCSQCTMSEDDSHLVIGHTSSGAEILAAKAPKAHVVSAFSTVPSEVLLSVFEAHKNGKPPDLVFCGDHDGAKRTAAHLIREAGFNPVDLGALTAARYIEPFSLLTAQIAYRGPDGPELAYRFEHFPVSNQ
jgi:8-hydroxy-5-deazaflavin:NADPH oxidoreductase